MRGAAFARRSVTTETSASPVRGPPPDDGTWSKRIELDSSSATTAARCRTVCSVSDRTQRPTSPGDATGQVASIASASSSAVAKRAAGSSAPARSTTASTSGESPARKHDGAAMSPARTAWSVSSSWLPPKSRRPVIASQKTTPAA